jgi:hypothetical protein
MVCELELKYGINYIEAFAFKQLACYVHYEALNVYEQHSLRILGVIQIPNPAYATAIVIACQAALQAAIAHHGIMPNNPNMILISVNFSPQQLITTIANTPSTIDAPTFANPVGEFFQILELEFLVKLKNFEIFLQLTTFFQQKDETLKMFYRRLLKLKEDIQSIIDLEVAHRSLCSLESTLILHAQVLQRVFAKFGDSYTLLNVYNISKMLELAHAHYEASIMKPPSHLEP